MGQRLTIAATGDLLFHRPLEQEALTPTGRYRDFWKPVASLLANADLTYANFEGTAADGVTTGLDIVKDPGRTWNNRVYTAPPNELSYNYHPSLIDDLIDSGFDVVSTANNHALDRGGIGIDRTVANFEQRGLAFTGTRPRDLEDRPFSIVTKVKGLNVAWLACTFDTNGFPDRHGQVLHCFTQRDQVLGEIRRLAANPEIDAVMLTPHWGIEGSPTPEKRQRDLAQEAIEAGATAIVGTHPHVQGPWEKLTAKDGREGLVIYSTGNFISNQRHTEQRMGEIALIELTKESGAAKMRVTAAGFVQTWVDITDVHRVTEAARAVVARPLPAGNRVFTVDLPVLPRLCDPGQHISESWGSAPLVTVAMLPKPSGPLPEPKSGAILRELPRLAASPAALPKLVVAAIQPVVHPEAVLVAAAQPVVSGKIVAKVPLVGAKLAGIAGLPTDGWLMRAKPSMPIAAVKPMAIGAKLAGLAGLPTDGWKTASKPAKIVAKSAADRPRLDARLAGLAALPTDGWAFAGNDAKSAQQVARKARPPARKRAIATVTVMNLSIMGRH